MLNVFTGGEAALQARSRQVVMAHVIAATLEQRRFNRQLQRITHARQVAVKQLILQRFGAGGDDDLAAREQRGHEVGKGFSGAGARLGDQLRVVRDGLGNGAGKLHLLRSGAKIGLGKAERTVGAEDALEVDIHPQILLGLPRLPVRLKSVAQLNEQITPVLTSLFTSTPKWQSSNADERLIAVATLAADDANLHLLATTDADVRVRTAAIAQSASAATFKAAMNDADAAVKAAATARWATVAAGSAPTADLPIGVIAAALREESSIEWKAAASRAANADLTAWLATAAPAAFKLDAINASTDVALLDKLHLQWRDHDKRLGKACHDRVLNLQSRDKAAQEADVLLAQLQSWIDADEVPLTKLVDTQRAWGKLTVDADRKAKFEGLLIELQRKMQNESAARRMHEALAMQVAGLSLKSKKAAEFSNDELNALAHDATAAQSSPALDAGLAQQLQQVHGVIAGEQQLREKNAAGEALFAAMPTPPPRPPRQERPAAPKKPREAKVEVVAAATDVAGEGNNAAPDAAAGSAPSLVAGEGWGEGAAAEVSPIADEAPSMATVASTNEAEPVVTSPKKSPEPQAALAETAESALVAATTESAVAPTGQPSEATDPEAAAVATARATAVADHAKAHAEYEAAHAEWKAKCVAWLATVDATTREHFERRLQALDKPAAAPKPERAVVPRAEDADLANANEHLSKLAELIAAGDVRGSRNAATKLYQQFTNKRFPKMEEQRLNELDGEVKRLESWLKWSDGQARDGIMARAEALKGSPLPPDELAREIRTIQDEWKALDKKTGGAPKPKWDKFNAVCKEAYAPAKAHFDTLRKQRNENASGREKIIDDLHVLADEAAAPVPEGAEVPLRDWLDIERRKSAMFDQWKKGGGVANAAWKALDEKFDIALKKLDGALDTAREPEIARRKKLIAEAEELAQATPSREVTDRAIAVQRRWAAERPQGLPHLRRKDEQNLWDVFKKNTDAVFKARDSERDTMKAQFSEGMKNRYALLDELKALVTGDDAKAIDAGIASARSKWREPPFVDRDKAMDMDRKFDDVLAAAKKRVTVLSRGGVIDAMKATLEKIPATESADKTAAALVIDAELIAGIDSPAEIATARRMQQLRWLSDRRQLPTAPDAKMTAIRTLLGAFNATGAKITLGERERLTRAIEAVGAA